MAVKWKNTSPSPSSLVMNPYPFLFSNALTFPVSMSNSFGCIGVLLRVRSHDLVRVQILQFAPLLGSQGRNLRLRLQFLLLVFLGLFLVFGSHLLGPHEGLGGELPALLH